LPLAMASRWRSELRNVMQLGEICAAPTFVPGLARARAVRFVAG